MKLFVGLMSLSFALAVTAAPPREKLKTTLQEKEVGLAYDLKNVKVKAGKTAGSLNLSFSVQYSNRCVAGGSRLTPLTNRHTEYDKEGEPEKNYVFVAVEENSLNVMCPMVFAPVVVDYNTEIDQLIPGADYEVHVLGVDSAKEPVKVITSAKAKAE